MRRLAAVAGGLGSVDLIKGAAFGWGAFVASDLGFHAAAGGGEWGERVVGAVAGGTGAATCGRRWGVKRDASRWGAAVEIDFIFQC